MDEPGAARKTADWLIREYDVRAVVAEVCVCVWAVGWVVRIVTAAVIVLDTIDSRKPVSVTVNV